MWEEVWQALNECFTRIADLLRAERPTLEWTSGHSDNEAFAFRAFASFSTRGPGEEDVVVSVDFERREGELYYSSDVAMEDGQVLADGPSGTLILATEEAVRKEVKSAVNAIEKFVLSSAPLIKEHIP